MSQLWMNGEYVVPGEARLDVFDHGITVGDGAFETLEVVDGQPFAVTRHLRRLHRSANVLGLTVPFADDVLAEALCGVAADQAGQALVRLTLTAGAGPLGSSRGDSACTVIVAGSSDLAPWPATTGVLVVPWTRNETGALTGVKSTSYAENVMALAAAHESGAGEAIFANTRGSLCEGTGSNIFVVVDGALTTPPLNSGCLAGVTRELLLEVVDADEVDLPIDRLANADEAFLTSSTRRIQAIDAVDGSPIPAPGPLTERAIEAFAQLLATDLDP